MEWISIKEKLPDHWQVVLFFSNGSKEDIYKYFVGRFKDGDKKYAIGMTSDIYISVEEITHWMPLPSIDSIKPKE